MDAYKYLQKLQRFPHRGTCSENERKAAEMLFVEYEKLGYKPMMQEFATVYNGWWHHSIYLGFYLLVGILILLSQPIAAGLLLLIALVQTFQWPIKTYGILRRLHPGKSQNVFVVSEPKGKVEKTLVIGGHIDTARRTVGVTGAMKLSAKFMGRDSNPTVTELRKKKKHTSIFFTFFRGPMFVQNIGLVALFLALILEEFMLIQLILVVISMAIFVPAFIVNSITALSAFVPGAGDNGTSAATVIALAEYFKNKPLQNTRIYFVNSGSEENVIRGMELFAQEYVEDKENTYFISLEVLGSKNLFVGYGESSASGLFFPYDRKSNEFMIEFATNSSKYQDITYDYIPAETDNQWLVRKGYKVMGLLISFEEYGLYKDYHQMTDTIDKVDKNTLAHATEYLRDLITEVDRKL